jgi:hypothetical protein
MMSLVKTLFIFVIACNWAALPSQAYTKAQNCCVCCKQTACKCGLNCKGLSEQSFHNRVTLTKSGHGNFKQCKDCSSHRDTEETFLLTDPSPELKKKPVLCVSHTIVSNNYLVMGADTEAILYDQDLLSSPSLFFRNESLRL